MFDDLETNKVLKDYFYSLPTTEEHYKKEIHREIKVGDVYRKIDNKLNEKGWGLIYKVVFKDDESNFTKIEGKLVELV